MSRQWLLVAIASLAACSSDSTPPETPRDQARATIGTAGGTLVTPSGAAGVEIPAGTFSQPVTVTVTQLASPSTGGAGPLPTALRQYPPYYEFSTSPAVPQFGDSVRVGVCQVTNPSDPLYAPEDDHPRLKLAHTVGSTVEILERVGVTDFLRCTNVTASAQSSSSSFALSSILSRATDFFRPRPAYAAHGGLGGKVKSFSPFGAVVDACVLPPVISANTTINGTVDASDCLLPGPGLLDVFTLSPAQPLTMKVTATGTVQGVAMVLSLTGQGVGNEIFDRDVPFTGYVVLPVGNFIMGVYTGSSTGRGTYTLALQTTTIPDGCLTSVALQGPSVILYPGITLAARITSNDCTTSQSGFFGDHYEVTLVGGQNYQLSATASSFLRLDVYLPDGNGSLEGQSVSSGTVSFTFQPTTTAVYIVDAIGFPGPGTVPYTLAITKL
jgi:hypothetical protein